MRGTICAVSLWLVATVCSAGPLDGRWNAHVVRTPPAANQDLVITLSTSPEGKVTGSMTIVGGPDAPIDWGMVKGDVVVFKVKMPFNDGTQMFVYLGKLEGDQIAFGRRPEDLTLGRLLEFTAVRAK
jgi:hypothetical protein